MEKDKSQPDLLLIRILNREASQEEIIFFAQWIRKAENKAHFERLKRIWNLTAGTRANSLTLQQGLDDYHRFMQSSSASRRKIKPTWKFAYAAAIVSFILASTFWLLRKEQVTEIPLAGQLNTKEVTLTVAGRERIPLLSDTVVTLEQHGKSLSISKNQQWEINYQKASTSDTTPIYNTITVPSGKRFALKLSDSTKVWLNSESSLSYPVPFGKNNREVEARGNVYFQVTKDPRCPFVVKTREMTAEVLGTAFEVNSYGDGNLVTTTLVEGKVRVSAGGKSTVIHPNQQFSYNITDKKTAIIQVNATNIVSWKDGILRIDQESFETMLRKFERWYGVIITNETGKTYNHFFQGQFTHEDLQTAMEVICTHLGVSCQIRNDSVFIRK